MKLSLSSGLRALLWVIASLFGWITLYFFVFKGATGYNNPIVLGSIALVSGLTILIPEVIFLHPRIRARFDGVLRVTLCSAIAVPIIMSWLGTFRWYGAGWGYDSFVHFVASGAGALIVLLVLVLVGATDFKLRASVFVIFVLMIFLGGTANELFERYSDLWWGTTMFGEPGEPNDTIRDLMHNILGATVGSVICLVHGERIAKYLSRRP
ncbi:hypothetical protein HY478_03705 [Candidatus Uhrbacteria bacterium]|nr:hypothetical protein [Candidatus Uhrbacteria bacterium]